MFEPNKNLASLHRYCTRNQNVDFRGPFLLGTENPSSWELSSYVWIFEREKANMQMSLNSPRAVFAHFRDQRNAGTAYRTSGRSNIASETSCWCKTNEIRIAKATACSML